MILIFEGVGKVRKQMENYVGKPRKVGKNLKKDAKQEFVDAYNNIKTGMKKNLSKENLKSMGKKISEKSKKPANQVIMSAVPMGTAPKKHVKREKTRENKEFRQKL
jgi:hypothetical protein